MASKISRPATKDDLSQLKRELKKDITQLKEEVKSDIALFKIDVDEKIRELEERISHLPTKDEFYTKMDEVVGELKTIREQTVISHRVSEHTDQLDNHEQRITGFEKITHL